MFNSRELDRMYRSSKAARLLRRSWRIGSPLGFPVDLKLSFLILLGLVFVAFGGLMGVLVLTILFASVLVHELGHAVVARHYGLQVTNIELGFLGGAARISGMPRRAKHEILFAAAGPAVSLVLAGVGLGLGAAVGSPLIATIGWINLVLAGFNLLPALPMDGGRILRAALTYRMSFLRATEVSVKIARVAAVGFVLLGLMGAWNLLLLAPFLWLMSEYELRMAHEVQAHLGGYPDDPDRELQTMASAAWERRQRRRGIGTLGEDDPRDGLRRYTIRQIGGRLVIERID